MIPRHILPCPNVAKGSRCLPCDDLADLEREISETEAHLAMLASKRRRIYRRMNSAHDPITSLLPAEIVSQIFAASLPVEDDFNYIYTAPLRLGAICASWREIAWSTPGLWTSIVININCICRGLVGVLSDWLDRSRELPLFLLICGEFKYTMLAGKFSSAHYRDTARQISDAITRHTHRWSYLILSNQCLKIIHSMSAMISRATRLETLKISGPFPQILDLGMLPNLKCLQLHDLQVGNPVSIQWERLTFVNAGTVTIDAFFDLLSKSAFLKHCTISFFDDTREHDAIHPIIQHNHLIFFSLLNWDEAAEIALSRVHCPALQHLMTSWSPSRFNALQDFVRNSSCRLTTLVFESPRDSMDDISEEKFLEFLTEIPSLETLELLSDYHFDYFTNAFLMRLSQSCSIQKAAANSQLSFLPILGALTLRLYRIDQSFWTYILDLLLQYTPQNRSMLNAFGGTEDLRPLHSLHIELRRRQWNNNHSLDPHIAQELLIAISASTIKATIDISSDMSFTDWLEQFVRSSKH